VAPAGGGVFGRSLPAGKTVGENPPAAGVAQCHGIDEERSMADLRIDEASQAALKARLASPEGKAALSDLARIIADAFARSLPADIDLALDTAEGREALRAAWPDIVDAFLFRRGPQPNKKKTARKAKPVAEDVHPKKDG
jgi:hypothetical protein